MAAVKINTFGGMVPAVDDKLIPDHHAAYSENTWLYSGKLAGLNQPKLLRALTDPETSKAYRIPNTYTDASTLLDAVWLEFADFNTDVVKSSIVNDTHDRYYFASSSDAPKYNTRARIANGDPAWLLGIPQPGAITVGAAGGSSPTTVSRAYVVTWVSAYGEEGPPSAPFLITGKQDDTYTVTLPEPDPADLGGVGDVRNLTKIRIYRTITSSAGVATYFFVAEEDITDEDYGDSATDEVVSANEQLASTTWTAPPSNLQGIVSLPNGMMAGWVGTELWYSEPYRPHAWPANYTLAVEFPIVGLGIVNQMLVICTQGNPMTATGINPASVTLSKLAALEPCLSRGSIVSTPEGVYYASQNGLMLVAQGQAVNITRKMITKDRWLTLAKVATLRAARLGVAYYAYGSARFGVFSDGFDEDAFAQEDFAGAFSGVLIDPTDERVAFNTLRDDLPATNVMNDPWSGELFIIREGNLYWVDTSDTAPISEPYIWRSKIYQSEFGRNHAALRVMFDVPATTPVQNPVRNTDAVQTLAADQYGLVRVFADDRLVMTRELRESGEIIRLPSGFKAEYWQLEFEARVNITSFHLAPTEKDLRRV